MLHFNDQVSPACVEADLNIVAVDCIALNY